MDEANNDVAKFGFVIKVRGNHLGSLDTKTEVLNQGIPVEVVIMKMKAYLRNLENKYYANFEAGGPNSA